MHNIIKGETKSGQAKDTDYVFSYFTESYACVTNRRTSARKLDRTQAKLADADAINAWVNTLEPPLNLGFIAINNTGKPFEVKRGHRHQPRVSNEMQQFDIQSV